MQSPLLKKNFLKRAALIAVCGGANAAEARDAGPRLSSRITSISVSGSQPIGTFGAVAYTSTWGTVTGIVASGESVHGLSGLSHDPDGNYKYESEFEIIAPAKPGMNSVIVVEAENRGNPNLLNTLHGISIAGPPSAENYQAGLGNGFLSRHATSYARVQGHTGIAARVPKQPQGVGEVIIRDFARMLGGRTQSDPHPPLD